MTDRKLVDELEKALRDEAYDGGFGYMGEEQFRAYVRTLAETAAEVFEKVHTPTDDEREALAGLIADGEAHPSFPRPERVKPFAHDYRAADLVIAAGFRRSEVRDD